MSFKEKILHYLDHGVFTPKETKEIASFVGCSVRYVQKVLKECNSKNSANQLTIEKYIKAILSAFNPRPPHTPYKGSK